ncbi:MAG: hypothetical protein O7C63_03450 [Alphaproteobacteria bacterium]|nr:hypothetical protein [Alphaproteobacteria bacterium]
MPSGAGILIPLGAILFLSLAADAIAAQTILARVSFFGALGRRHVADRYRDIGEIILW